MRNTFEPMHPNARAAKAVAVMLPLLAYMAMPVMAQTSSGATGGTSTPGQSSPGTAAGNKSSAAGSQRDGKGSRIAEADREMMVDLAQANLAEIATGKLALDKSQDPKIDKFAQQMLDDHTKALDDLKKVAQGKGVELPPETDFVHKRC